MPPWPLTVQLGPGVLIPPIRTMSSRLLECVLTSRPLATGSRKANIPLFPWALISRLLPHSEILGRPEQIPTLAMLLVWLIQWSLYRRMNGLPS